MRNMSDSMTKKKKEDVHSSMVSSLIAVVTPRSLYLARLCHIHNNKIFPRLFKSFYLQKSLNNN